MIYYPAILVEVSLWVIPASPCLGRTVETIFFSSSIASRLILNLFHNVTTGPGISSPSISWKIEGGNNLILRMIFGRQQPSGFFRNINRPFFPSSFRQRFRGRTNDTVGRLRSGGEMAISCQTWSLKFNEIRQNARWFKRDGRSFTQLQESFVSES